MKPTDFILDFSSISRLIEGIKRNSDLNKNIKQTAVYPSSFGYYLTFSIALFPLPVTPYIALSIDDKATKESNCVFMLSDTISAGLCVSLLDSNLIYKQETNVSNLKSTFFKINASKS